MIQDILVPFLTIGLAELGDKTQLAILCLASKTRRHLQLLLGIILAFVIADGLAVFLGNYITNLIPNKSVKNRRPKGRGVFLSMLRNRPLTPS